MTDLKDLFGLVYKRHASDLLITAGSPPVLRVDGKLVREGSRTLRPEDCKRMVYSVLSTVQRDKFEKRHELDLSLAPHGKFRFRVNVYMQSGSVAAAFRPIPDEVPPPEELGIPKKVLELTAYPQGLILVTGPTGHGKTTTQASLIDLINRNQEKHIITVEDPIEYVHKNKKSIVDQREVGSDTRSFANALKYVLRQAPDVILVGEMRDLETISSALTAAETGHLVLATLHTNDAMQTIDRMVDVFPAHQQQQIRFQLSMSLLAVLSQRLIPRSDGKRGRVLACELLHNNRAVANLIRDQKTHQIANVMQTHVKDGMIVMDSSIKELLAKGLISRADAERFIKDPLSIASV
ncbi:MAG: type IV pilus twitching motility protein PilT [Candidatus Hydrogenedentes bacterium]|nr:type IV pilus twitching motility protein PilT [Candidatus Hydrogenedentota bacterium]